MAEARRLTDLVHGHVGRLTYLPPEDETSQLGSLHTSRVTSKAPQFKVIGSSAELYPPSKSPAPEVSSNLWQERRTQRRWLLQAHPEAFMGNSALQGLLEENMNRFSKVEGEASDRPLLSIGQMTNVSDPWRVTGAPMLAVAAGESGELLRLARIDESKWQWGHNKDTVLNLSVIDPDDVDEEVIWSSDGLPISQVKFATSLTRYDVVRWLIVQKQTSTTILQPEYHKVPVSQTSTGDDGFQQRLSRIDPNPVVTLSHKKTGGNAQVDVAFNPNSKGQQPQIAIMDECGYWTIWDVIGNKKNNTRLSLQKCGHISEGLLSELPLITDFPAEKHGILFVGTANVDSFWDDATQDADETNGLAGRSSHLLLWNREKYETIDLESNMALPRLSILAQSKVKPDSILDIRVSPANQNHIFVLTMRNLYWIDLFAPSRGEDASPKPTILVACPHIIDGEGLRMTTCPASEDRQDAAMVFTFSPSHRQIHTYWFERSKEKGLPEWHRQVLTFPHENAASQGNIQSLEIHPVQLTRKGHSASGLGSKYLDAGVHFYQGSMLTKDLGVRYCICTSVKDHDMQITLPTGRVGRSKTDQAHRWRKKRKQFLRQMGDAFVLPDGIADAELDELVRPPFQSKILGSQDTRASGVLGPIHLKFDFICRALRDHLFAISTQSHDIPSGLLSAIQGHIAEGLAEGSLPLSTWKEIGEGVDNQQLENGDDAAQHDMLDLFLEDDGHTVVTQLGRQTSQEWVRSLISLSHLNQTYVDLWLDPFEGRLPEEDERARQGWVANIARDMFLATAGVMVQDIPLLGAAGGDDGEERLQSQATSVHIKPSQSSDPVIPSSPVSTSSNTTSDAAIRRLQLLAPSLRLDKMASAKQSTVLSYWPTERGVSTENYVSSVAVASDRKFDEARQRLRKIENKRKAQAEKYKLPPFMRQGGESRRATQGSSQVRSQRDEVTELPALPAPPPAQFMSSQQRVPESSQSQGLFGPSFAMSQPVSGVFGDRKKVKKGKRKSGFR